MNIKIITHNNIAILYILEDITLRSDISDLLRHVKNILAAHARLIAFHFTPESYLSTKSIAALMNCLEEIKERGGIAAIVDANRDIREVLNMIDSGKLVSFCRSESDLRAILEPAAA
ncbi:MAG: hypothetical protein GF398_18690 [Chitinivibrionales bacterium]|nr:hypothetical protein [Chitinivibrionales bacterium]